MKLPKTLKATDFKPGWRRTLADGDDRPVTLPPVPWEIETKEDSK